jgi:hypothetical protein
VAKRHRQIRSNSPGTSSELARGSTILFHSESQRCTQGTIRRAGTVEVDTHLERKPSLLSVVKLSSHTKLELQYLLFILLLSLQATHYRAVLGTLVLYEVLPKDIYKCFNVVKLHVDLYLQVRLSDVIVSQTWMCRCFDTR